VVVAACSCLGPAPLSAGCYIACGLFLYSILYTTFIGGRRYAAADGDAGKGEKI
jgi:hypothetical protein